ncbi:MAG: class I SAM-dependent methyltransferase, partial [Longimicrobiales bacterium]
MAPEARIDERYYNESTYFEGARHLQDFGSRFQRYRVRMVLSLHRPGPDDRVLDLGCGWGTITFAMGPLAKEVIGLDFSSKAVASCNKRLASTDLTNVRFVEGDARNTGLDSDSQ